MRDESGSGAGVSDYRYGRFVEAVDVAANFEGVHSLDGVSRRSFPYSRGLIYAFFRQLHIVDFDGINV